MVIEEKGLLAAMKDAYKLDGYKVAVEDSAGVENVILSTGARTVVILKSALPRKVLGMIAEHIGDIPKPGTAYQVKKKETQTEIFSMVAGIPMEFHSGEKPMRIVRRTSLTLGGAPLWQAATDQRVVTVNPDYEDIVRWWGCTVRLVGDDVLMADDEVSRAYILRRVPKGEQEREQLEHLAKIQWVSE